MSEVETLRHMYSVSDPLRKVCITDHPPLLGIFVHYNLLQVIIVNEAFFLSEVSQNILDSNKTIMIRIESQECFSN